MNSPVVILHLEDDALDAELVRDKLQQSRLPYDLRIASGRKEFEAALNETRFDLIISDYNLPDYDGMTALALACEKQPHVPFIMISGQLGEEKALECIHCGATDYVPKHRLDWLVPAVVRALAEAEERQKRRESEERYRTLFEDAQDGMALAEAKTGLIVDCNRALCRMVERDKAELVGQPQSILHPTQTGTEKVTQTLRQHREGDPGQALEDLLLSRSDKLVPVEIRAASIRMNDRDYLLGVFRDVTERKRAEEVLRASEEKHRTLFESSRDAIMTLAPPSWRFTTGNPAAIEMFGARDVAVFTTLGPWDLAPESQPDGRPSSEKAIEMIQTAMATGSHSFEWTHRRLGGESFPSTVLLTRMELGGQALLQATVRDITDSKRAEAKRENLEEQIRASQKMEAIGSLAGGVAHDFNNLLSVILNYTGFVLDGVREGDPQREDLLEVKKAAERAVALTRQLLAFGRKQILQPVSLNLNEVAVGVEKMLRRILGEDVDFVQMLAPDLGLTLADPGQIEQVLMNLVVNARDAMPEGGKLTIETSNVEIDEEYAGRHADVKPGSYVRLAVSDTGCGMDEQTRARIFEPFFTTKERGKGTGLGLSTVYGIVKQSRGNIRVYSELGQGTTFKIYLPRELSATTVATIKPTPMPTRSTGTETILVVEDEEALRKVAERTLSAAGYTALTAANGEEALLLCAQHVGEIHLLLTDVVMPRMGGRVLAQEIAKTRPNLGVVYMSGYTDNAIVHHGVLDPGTHFLAKPFTSSDLTRKIREVLDSAITDVSSEHLNARSIPTPR